VAAVVTGASGTANQTTLVR